MARVGMEMTGSAPVYLTGISKAAGVCRPPMVVYGRKSRLMPAVSSKF